MRITLVVGAATPPGRLTQAVARLATAIAERSPGSEVRTLDLNASPVEILDGRPPEHYGPATRQAVASLERAAAVVLASPVYRGTIPGALKNLLDHLPPEALRGKPVGIVVMGASLHHYLGAESHLRDILAWFGAIALPTQVYLVSADFENGVLTGGRALAEIDELSASLLELAGRLSGSDLRPLPLPLATAARPQAARVS